jgi:hypothetical protein
VIVHKPAAVSILVKSLTVTELAIAQERPKGLRLADASPLQRSGLDGTDLGADMGVLPDTRGLALAR